jgi:aminoglycoside phosphotransferase (APT) family kinase protein
MNDVDSVLSILLGDSLRQVSRLTSGNNQVFRVRSAGGHEYLLKCFDKAREVAFQREVGMRECLRRYGDISFPEIIGHTTLGEVRYILMEYVTGDSLEEVWAQDQGRPPLEMARLGRLLARLHGIPVDQVRSFLAREDELYSHHHFSRMMAQIDPYVRGPHQIAALKRCHELIRKSVVREVVIHGDFGPHQVVVDKDDTWFLVDFEYSALGAFADDLAGTEVRLDQRGYATEPFLAGYAAVRHLSAQYETVRSAYKAYSLLAILTYRLAWKDEEPPERDLRILSGLLA